MTRWDDVHVQWRFHPYYALERALTVLAIVWATTVTALLIWSSQHIPAVQLVDETGAYVGPLYTGVRGDTITISVRSVP